jgi:predicted  nucleic acid-binding Zn-ribbon protein
MEHSCHACGVAVEDGVPFCPQCGAPQIRVVAPEANDPTLNSAGGEFLPADQPLAETGRRSAAAAPAEVDWARGVRASIVASLLAAILAFVLIAASGMPLLGFACWALLGGMFASAIYRRRAALRRVSSHAAARLGALSGVLGFLTATLLSSVQLLIFGGAQFRAALEEQVHRSAAAADPTVQQWLDYFLSPRGLAVMMIASLLFTLAMFVSLSSIGGILGAKLFVERDR